jgi:hypothetical protein
LLVEGPSDARVFNGLADGETCEVISGHGKARVISAMSILNDAGFRGALGIVDADFRSILPVGGLPLNVLYTDGHDLDCMLLASAALDRLLDELATRERVNAYAAKHGGLMGSVLARNAMPVGCFVAVSLRSDLGLDFERLDFSRFVAIEDLSVSVPKLVRAVLDKNSRHDLDGGNLEQQISAFLEAGHSPWEVSRGPDILEVLSLGLRKTFASRDRREVSPEMLASGLRLAYGSADFVGTRLCREILNWERTNAPYQILRSADA